MGEEFPGGPVVKTLCFHCRGPRFNPWLGGTEILQVLQLGQKKKKGLGPTMEGNCQVILTATIVDKLEKVKTYIRVPQL